MTWAVDLQGYNFGGASLGLSARDLAKFGYLYLNGGRWDGHRWSRLTTCRRDLSGGLLTDVSSGYGWLWWVGDRKVAAPHFFAHGRGGQYIYVVPDVDLVAVVTSDVETSGPGFQSPDHADHRPRRH